MKRILVLQRGWVAVGDYSADGDEVMLTNTSIIRRWGTSKGLGELAACGPLSGTTLDPCGTLRVHKLAIVLMIDCEESKWSM